MTLLMTLLEAVVEQVTLPLQDLPIMSHEDRQQLAQWSGQDAGWADAADGLSSQQFAAQVERSADMLVGLLGIFKAGAVYLPIDPAYPAECIRFMLEQAQVRLVLSQQAVLERVFTPQVLPADTALFALDSQWFALLQQPLDNPPLASAAEQLAYLIYTSGSTGQPKGVMVEQDALASHTRTMQQQFGLGANDRVLQFASMSFDVVLEQILPALIRGARVVIAQPHWSLDEFTTHLQAQQVTACLSASGLGALANATVASHTCQFAPIVGNDVLPPETMALWREMEHVGDELSRNPVNSCCILFSKT